jgi:hypothetical protein
MRTCKSCKRETPHTNKLGLCSDCDYSYGEVWVLNIAEETWARRKPASHAVPQST